MRTLEQQIELMDKIREASNHCLAGWAEVLNEEPTGIKDTAELWEFLLPDFAKFFYDKRGTAYLEKYLEARAYALEEGEVVKYQGSWIDRGCNFYSGELNEEQARVASLTNNNCTGCTYCTGCAECTNLT